MLSVDTNIYMLLDTITSKCNTVRVNMFSLYTLRTVGASPASAVVFTKDCRTILIANEGEAGKDDLGNFIDPEGSVTIIKFETSALDTANYTVQNVDFRKYDER